MSMNKHPQFKRHASLITGLLAAPLLLASCNKTASGPSTVKTLDNAARGAGDELVVNQCGMTYTGKEALPSFVAALDSQEYIVSADKDIKARQAVLGTLAAVPRPLLQLFFAAAAGRIEIGSTEACQDTPFTSEEKQLAGNAASIPSCWAGPSGDKPLRIIMQADERLIKFALIRLFTYVHTEYFVAQIQDPAAPAPFNEPVWRQYIDGFNASRDQLATAFLKDVATKNHSDALDRLTSHNRKDPASFGNLVYANAVDSYYCSSETRDVFRRDFQSTWSVFASDKSEYAPAKQLGPTYN